MKRLHRIELVTAKKCLWRLHLPLLHLFGNLHDEVRVIALVTVGSDKVVEPDKANSQIFGLGVLQTLHDDLHNRDEVLLQRSSNSGR